MPREEIESIVHEIQTAKGVKNKEKHFEVKHSAFKAQYPHLYKMACTDNMNMSMFRMMLDMLDKINAQTTTSNDASVEVGQQLFQAFVKPNLKDAKTSDRPGKGPVFTFNGAPM